MDATTSTGSGGDLNNATNPYVGWQYDFGPSQFDRRQISFFNYVYEIPFLRNSSNRFAKATLGGWELSGIVTIESGAPLNLGLSGSNASSIVPNSGNRPDVNRSISYPKTAASWFSPAAFSAPVCATGPDCYGNLGFDALRGPGRDNWNMSLLKNFAFTERLKLQFRADAFNMWNHTQIPREIRQQRRHQPQPGFQQFWRCDLGVRSQGVPTRAEADVLGFSECYLCPARLSTRRAGHVYLLTFSRLPRTLMLPGRHRNL